MPVGFVSLKPVRQITPQHVLLPRSSDFVVTGFSVVRRLRTPNIARQRPQPRETWITICTCSCCTSIECDLDRERAERAPGVKLELMVYRRKVATWGRTRLFGERVERGSLGRIVVTFKKKFHTRRMSFSSAISDNACTIRFFRGAAAGVRLRRRWREYQSPSAGLRWFRP